MDRSYNSMFNAEHAESKTISQANIETVLNLGRRELEIFLNSSSWARITIKNGGKYDKDLLLRKLMNSVSPEKVFPVLYQVEGNDSFFLIRNNYNFISKILSMGLKFYANNEDFDLSITTAYLSSNVERLNVYEQIHKAMIRRYDNDTRTLDLTNFSEDKHLKDIYFHLNIPQCLSFLFDLGSRTRPYHLYQTLILSHNDIRQVSANLFLQPNLRELDLRHNNLTWVEIENFFIKKCANITSIWLDGNPVCINLSESEYIKKIKTMLPNLKKVDGIDVFDICELSGYFSYKNFFYNSLWGPFVNHFLHHYFGLMEHKQSRTHLTRMYHQKAIFSVSVSYDPKDQPHWSKFSTYSSLSRNLLTLSDMTKAYQGIKIGPNEIVDVLFKFPDLNFDYHSFNVDVPFCITDSLVLINVSGIFLEQDSNFFFFDRSFILSPYKKNPGEWKIENDMLAVAPATPEQAEKSFTVVRRPVSPKMQLKLSSDLADQELLVKTVCDSTKLTPEWAVKFLEESSWNLEMTFQAFTDQLKSNQLPQHAFMNPALV